MRRGGRLFAVLGIAILLLIVLAVRNAGARTAVLHVGGVSYSLEVVTSEAAQELGLGNRTSLPMNDGMLFPSVVPGKQCFWMKGMQFPLDMIWVSNTKKVTHIEHGVSPESYPHSYCAQGSYVIELNAGQATASKIHVGETLQF
jgi:uncharacterized membrane protein (UPF0127 family)